MARLFTYSYTVTDDGELIINKSEKHECIDIDEALEIAGDAYREMREARCDWWPDIPAIPEEFDQIFSDLLTWEYTEIEQIYGTMSLEARKERGEIV